MNQELQFLQKLKPAVRKFWLYLTAGLVWFGAGFMLISFASRWIRQEESGMMILLTCLGLLLAAAIYFFGFSKLAKKNIERIDFLDGEKICFFAFQGWTSYPLVAFMMSLGIYLRTYSAVPRFMLAVLYLGIGGGLLSASLHYFLVVIQARE